MKYGIIVVLLTSVCSMMPSSSAHPNATRAVITPGYQQMVNQYILLYGMIRANIDAPVRVQHVMQPALPQQRQRPELQIVVQPMPKKQKKQKQQYFNNNKNNNRHDRQKHAQTNKRIHQPQRRG